MVSLHVHFKTPDFNIQVQLNVELFYYGYVDKYMPGRLFFWEFYQQINCHQAKVILFKLFQAL